MIVEVCQKRDAEKFLSLPEKLYRKDPSWIAVLEDDMEAVFDPARNHRFQQGECCRWLAVNGKGETIGRIAAFIDYKKTAEEVYPVGGFGFFECIANEAVAHQLFDTAKAWLQSRNMKAMEGPENFGENDRFWGLLVEGFRPPSYGMNYNPPYYIKFFESYGFKRLYDQLTNVLDATQPLPERFNKIADWVMQKPGYHFEHFRLKDKEKFFRDFVEIYNDAWASFHDFYPLDLNTIRESFRQMEPLADEKIIWFAYHNGEPVSFILCMPDANQILKHVHGKLNFFNKIRFLWHRQFSKVDRLRIVVMGCKQRFQNHGIESALIRCLQNEVLPRKTIKEVELAWVGDFNKKMLALHYATGARQSKVHRTYRFDF